MTSSPLPLIFCFDVKTLEPFLLIVFAVLGFVAARYAFTHKRSLAPYLPSFGTREAKVQLLLFLAGVQGAVWLSSTMFLFTSSTLVRHELPPRCSVIFADLAGLVLLFALIYFMRSHKDEELATKYLGVEGKWGYSLAPLPKFAFIGVIAALLQVAAMWWVVAELQSRRWSGMEGLKDFLEFRALIDNHLLIAATILGLGTLAGGVLRSVLNDQEGSDFMPALHIVLFGLAYSFLLALAYAPAYLVTQSIGQTLSRELLESTTTSGFLTGRKGLDELLRLQPGSFALTGAIPIAAPFFIGLISSWLKTDSLPNKTPT